MYSKLSFVKKEVFPLFSLKMQAMNSTLFSDVVEA